MRYRFTVIGLLAGLLAGCGTGDRLKPGDVCLTTGSKEKSGVMVDTQFAKGSSGPDRAFLPFGTRVRIVDDADAKPDDDKAGRPVRIYILDGEQKDVAGVIPRKFLTEPVKP